MMLLVIFLGILVDQGQHMLITLPVFMPIGCSASISSSCGSARIPDLRSSACCMPPPTAWLLDDPVRGVAPPDVTMAAIFRRRGAPYAMRLVCWC